MHYPLAAAASLIPLIVWSVTLYFSDLFLAAHRARPIAGIITGSLDKVMKEIEGTVSLLMFNSCPSGGMLGILQDGSIYAVWFTCLKIAQSTEVSSKLSCFQAKLNHQHLPVIFKFSAAQRARIGDTLDGMSVQWRTHTLNHKLTAIWRHQVRIASSCLVAENLNLKTTVNLDTLQKKSPWV